MKKAVSIILLVGLLYFLYQLGANFLKNEHSIEYTITTNDKKFSVIEKYNKKEYNNQYYLEINIDNNKFFYEIKNSFNKITKIIDRIKYIEKDGMLCIYPILVNKKEYAQIECSSANNTYSYDYVKTISSVPNELVEELKKDGFNSNSWNNDETVTVSDAMNVYQKNIIKNDYITIWTYSGVRQLSKDKVSKHQYLATDVYENILGTQVDKYYIIPLVVQSFEFKKIIILNVENDKSSTLEFEDPISTDSYVNGVVDNKLYIFDNDNLKQIEIDPKEESYEIIGTTASNGQFYNGKVWEDRNIYDFKTNKLIFSKDYSKIDELQKYNAKKILESNLNYYILSNDGIMYKVNKSNLNNGIIMFKNKNISELKLSNETIYYIAGDSLYYSDIVEGNKLIVKYNEFNYNNRNIFDVYKKS